MEANPAITEYDFLMKIQLGGSTSAGKTSIIQKYTTGASKLVVD